MHPESWNSDFLAGSQASLEAFLAELRANRGHIENEDEPVFDVIVHLLERTIAGLQENR